MTCYIYAVGLHSQGGLNILNRFLEYKNEDFVYFLDSRLKTEKKKNYIFVNSNHFMRILHFIKLRKILKPNDHILFLNGLPPILNLKCKTSVAFQNANLFRDFYKINFLKWIFSLDSIRYLNFKIYSKFVDNWYIFSPRAEEILKKKLKKYINIKIVNIYENIKMPKFNMGENQEIIKFDFIYPASLMEHKNHRLLINTLIELSKDNIFPRVLITLDKESLLKINYEEIVNRHKLKLYNNYEKNHKKFLELYKQSKCLLYLSENETIGLPILEAYSQGLITIAPNLPYSSQFIEPDYVFDLKSKTDLKELIVKILHKKIEKKNNFKPFKFLNNSISFDQFVSKVL